MLNVKAGVFSPLRAILSNEAIWES